MNFILNALFLVGCFFVGWELARFLFGPKNTNHDD